MERRTSTGASMIRHLDAGRLPTVALVTYVVSLVAWVALVERWLPMPGGGTAVAMPMTAPGVPETMALSNGLSGVGLYLLLWGVMMVAMMYPSSVPLFRLYYRTIDGATRAGTAVRVGAFMATYAAVWALTGVVPLFVNAVVPVAAIARDQGGLFLGGSLLLLATYQLSPLKDRCLRYCRTPLGFLLQYHEPGVLGAARMSLRFSAFCVGCCWALMALMVLVGSMNILWMAGIAVVLSLERVVSWGDRLAKGVGVAAGLAGVAICLLAVAPG